MSDIQTFNITPRDQHIAKLSALAIGIHIAEFAIPSPIPGIKPGLANLVVLYTFYRLDLSAALWVLILRLFAGGLISANLFSPTFMISAGGVAFTLLALILAKPMSRYLSAVGVSILMAFFNVHGQLILAYALFIHSSSIFLLLPLITLVALLTGSVNGILVEKWLAHGNAKCNSE